MLQIPMGIKSGDSVYMIGIGGIGMSALARFFNRKGIVVSGYDRTKSKLTDALEKEGIRIRYQENVDELPRDAKLVVYTPAVPGVHSELKYYREKGYHVVKRSEVLQWITENSYNICIAGTHGKTTISTMIAYILRESGYGCNAFLGGISANYNTNFWSDPNNVSVIEADEYDRSFLKLAPDIAVITAMDADHLDIYGTKVEVENAFIQFSQKLKPGGLLLTKYGLARNDALKADQKSCYDLENKAADIYASDIRVEAGVYRYNVVHREWKLKDVSLHMGGLHNIENSLAAITLAKYLNVQEEQIKTSLSAFRGVKRRFEYIIKSKEAVLIDDYAHHPEEIKALIKGVRSLFADQKCTVIFQPHLFSRTRDLAKEFAQSLDLADEVILLPVYPARELPVEGVSSNLILREMKLENKRTLAKEEMLNNLKSERPKLVVMCGAGDIDALVEPVKQIILNY